MKRDEVKTIIFRYIFGYYNTQRVNSFNEGGLPPVALRSSRELSHHVAFRFWVFSDCTFLDNSTAYRLYAVLTAKFVDEQVPFICLYFFRSFAKKPSASFKISLAFLSSAFSRSSSRFRFFSSSSDI